jgi:hypothetical protein
MKWMQRSIVALLVAGALSLGLAGPAAAQPQQDGLVNVFVNDVTILENVNVAVAAQVVAAICDLQVGPVVVLGRAIDRGAEPFECDAVTEEAPIITIENN